MVQESVAVAKRFFKDISIPFFDFLETTTFEETHDIADAALFTLMALEETAWYSTWIDHALHSTYHNLLCAEKNLKHVLL